MEATSRLMEDCRLMEDLPVDGGNKPVGGNWSNNVGDRPIDGGDWWRRLIKETGQLMEETGQLMEENDQLMEETGQLPGCHLAEEIHISPVESCLKTHHVIHFSPSPPPPPPPHRLHDEITSKESIQKLQRRGCDCHLVPQHNDQTAHKDMYRCHSHVAESVILYSLHCDWMVHKEYEYNKAVVTSFDSLYVIITLSCSLSASWSPIMNYIAPITKNISLITK